MIIVTVLEILIAALILAAAWRFIVRPLYQMATRPRRRWLGSLDDIVGETNVGERLVEAKRRLGDERALTRAHEIEQRAATERQRRESTKGEPQQ